jgi:type I restriction-modification system DNA methylase subunit
MSLDSVIPSAKKAKPTRLKMKSKPKKQEALTVSRFIHEILVKQLSIPFKQIVNDTTFASYTGAKRPDLLISEFEYEPAQRNDTQFIENIVAYGEAKDDAVIGDKDWQDAYAQGLLKAPKLKLPYFIVTNCKTTIFYNAHTGKELKLNGNPIREFQAIDILRLIKKRLLLHPSMENIITNVDSLATISEAIFNKKLWELAKIYRGIKFDSEAQKIDFTIGFISLEYFEEREQKKTGKVDQSKIYWSKCTDGSPNYPAEELTAKLAKYISRLEQEEQFGEFVDLMETVRIAITGEKKQKPIVSQEDVKAIYTIIDSMKPLHKTGFDLFGAVYEAFASPTDKRVFGQYFTRRHYAAIFAKLLLRDHKTFNETMKFTILDPACGTGGFLTEAFKVLSNAYAQTNTLTKKAEDFLSEECLWGTDVKSVNISRTKLNMFLVGDSHTHMEQCDTLEPHFRWNHLWHYIITNPPVGPGTVKADTSKGTSYRLEVAFLFKVISLLMDGGRACILLPDGVLENLMFSKIRQDFLEKCTVEAVISIPKFAFAPYTKEKMQAVYFTKRNAALTKIQSTPIWMYIVDNDGLANSDKRFPTKLRNNRNGWMHDEIAGWVSTDGDEMPGLLEERFMTFDDSVTGGTQWINEYGETVKLRKGGLFDISRIKDPQSQYCLLPEFYLRPFEPRFITKDELDKEMKELTYSIAELASAA